MKKLKKTKLIAVLMLALMCINLMSMSVMAGYDETAVQESDDEPTAPLTPEGNLTLVDDVNGEQAENKQFVTVQSKNGNFFYLVIDRDGDKENVYFLNLVDEADLLALLEDAPVEPAPEPVCICTDKCEVGDINVDCPVCIVDKSVCLGEEKEPPTVEITSPTEEKSSLPIVVAVLLICGVGGAVFYIKVIRVKKNAKGSTNLDDYVFEGGDDDNDEYDYYSEDESDDEDE